jgi:hypothetical protein
MDLLGCLLDERGDLRGSRQEDRVAAPVTSWRKDCARTRAIETPAGSSRLGTEAAVGNIVYVALDGVAKVDPMGLSVRRLRQGHSVQNGSMPLTAYR